MSTNYRHLFLRTLLFFVVKGFSYAKANEQNDSSVDEVSDDFEFLTELIPLNNATKTSLKISPFFLEKFSAPNLIRYSSKNDLTDFLKPHAKSASKFLFGSNVSHVFSSSILKNLTRIQSGEMNFVAGLWYAVKHHNEGEQLLKFGEAMLVLACGMPVTGLIVLILRLKFGLLGARFQRYNIKLYRALWLGFSFILFVCVGLLLTTLVVVAVAGTGLNRSLQKFPETTIEILSDFELAATNVGLQLSHLENEDLTLAVQTIDRHIRAMAPLISQAIWDSVFPLIKAGVLTLKKIGDDVVAIQEMLAILNNDLMVATDTFQNVTQFFRSQKTELEKFKADCTTPYFCDRIDGDVFVSKVDPQKLSIQATVNAAQDVMDNGLPDLIDASCQLFRDTGTLIKQRANKTLEIFQDRLTTWKNQIRDLVDPMLALNQPLVNSISNTKKIFDRDHTVGIWTSSIMYGFFAVEIILIFIALLWTLGAFCGCCYYQPVALPLSRSLDSDCSGIVLMGVTYFSLFVSSFVTMTGVAIITAASVGDGVMCPWLQTGVYDQQRIDQIISTIVEQNPTDWTHSKTNTEKNVSIGLALQTCSQNESLLDLLNFTSIKPKNASGETDGRFLTAKFYVNFIYNISKQTNLLSLFQNFDVDFFDQKFYPEILDHLLNNYQEILKLNLQEKEILLKDILNTKKVTDSLDELRKIAEGLVSKPQEQKPLNDLITLFDDEFTGIINKANSKTKKILHNVTKFGNEIKIFANSMKRFSDLKGQVVAFAETDLSKLAKKKTDLFKLRITGFFDQYTDFFHNQTTTQIGDCVPFLNAMKTFGDFVCDFIIADMLLLGFGLIAVCFTFIPACVISVLLSRQLLILKESNHVEDHYDRTLPAEIRKLPRPAHSNV